MARQVVVTADNIAKRKKKYNNLKLILSIVFIILLLIFIILSVIYNGGRFTVTLDPTLALENGIVIYEEPEIKEYKSKLTAKDVEFMDNISINWIPRDIDVEANGSHNGENYIAYTFYIENSGNKITNYWYSVVIDDVIKNVDEAARIMIFLNGEKSVYAKINSYTKLPENDTKAFFSDNEAVLEKRENFKPGDVDKFTVVIWLEGDDPDCIDNILGGEIKMHMEIREEHKEQNDEKKDNKKKTYRLFYLLLLLFVTTITLSFSSYAWFTANRLVSIDLLNVNVRAQGGIEISVDGTNWKSVLTVMDIENARNNYPNSLNQLPNTLEPVSTCLDIENGKLKMFYGTAINNTSGKYILETVRSVEEESFGDNSSGKFIVFDLFFKTNQDTMIYLTPDSKVTYSGESSVGIENAARIAFIDEGTTFTGSSISVIQSLVTNNSEDVYIWEPNYDTHTQHSIDNALNLYGISINSPGNKISYDGVTSEITRSLGITVDKANSTMYPMYFKNVDVDISSVNGFTNNIEAFNLRSGISKYRIYMWIEGQDVDCENNASFGNMAFNLQFTTNPS